MTTQKKIIVSDATLGAGGAERVLSVLSASFADHYDEVVYITWIDVPDFYPIDKRISRVCIERECGSKNILSKALWFRKYVKRIHPDLVLSFLTPYNVLVSASLIGVDVPLVVAERNDPSFVWNSFVKRNIRRLAYVKPVGILVQTQKNQSYFKGKYLEKTFVIYNPIIMDSDYRGKALRTDKKNRIVSVSRLMKQKNQDMLLKAFKIFHDSHPEYTLTIYGKGEYRPEVERLIEKYGLTSSVELPGATDNLWNEIVDAKCFALSSWYEGMPNALLEALCLGLPCVSTRVSGSTDLIETGKNGYLVDLDDYQSMAKHFSDIIDGGLGNTIGQKATNIYNKLKVEVISRQWIEYIDQQLTFMPQR